VGSTTKVCSGWPMNLLRSPEDAQDVYQEAFLRVFRNLDKFRFDCSFHTWLYRIVTNLCLTRCASARCDARSRRCWRRRTVRWTAWTRSGRNAWTEIRKGTCSSGQLRNRIKQVLDGLTARERMVFELRHYQGLRLRRIGEILGTTRKRPRTACSGQHRRCGSLWEIL